MHKIVTLIPPMSLREWPRPDFQPNPEVAAGGPLVGAPRLPLVVRLVAVLKVVSFLLHASWMLQRPLSLTHSLTHLLTATLHPILASAPHAVAHSPCLLPPQQSQSRGRDQEDQQGRVWAGGRAGPGHVLHALHAVRPRGSSRGPAGE
jgi:hypothetical protein